MKLKNITIFLAIGVLFIGTIFFSGCSSEDLEGYMDKGKDTLDEYTSNEKTCEDFCKDKGYDMAVCTDMTTTNDGRFDECDQYPDDKYYCFYNVKFYNVKEHDIKDCDEINCVCNDKEACGSDNSECEIRCTPTGCENLDGCDVFCKGVGFDEGDCSHGAVSELLEQGYSCQYYVYENKTYCEYGFEEIDMSEYPMAKCDDSDARCICKNKEICDDCLSTCTANGC